VDISSSHQDPAPAAPPAPGPAARAQFALLHGLRDLSTAITDGVVAVIGLPLVLITLLGLVLRPLGVGVPVTVGVLRVVRSVTGWQRGRAGAVLGRPVESPYQPAPASVRARFRAWVREPATWRDLGWLAVNTPLGIAAAAISAGLWIGVLECLFAPLIEPIVPSGVVFDPLFFEITSQPLAWLALLAAPLVAVLAVVVPGLLLKLRAHLAAVLLGPTATATLRTRVGRLSASRDEAVDSSAAELRRIERDLHDGPQVRLVSLAMKLGIAEDVIKDDPDLARRMVMDARDSAGEVLGEIRGLVRGIHPPVLADRGLPGAAQALALASPIPVTLNVELPRRLPPAIESSGYFVLAEVLANAIRHSGATAIMVAIRHDGRALLITVSDDGRGGAEPGGGSGSGLRGIQRRLSAFDGLLLVTSPVGGPTVLHMEIPCES
jgi:signal transduction histidine kinase